MKRPAPLMRLLVRNTRTIRTLRQELSEQRIRNLSLEHRLAVALRERDQARRDCELMALRAKDPRRRFGLPERCTPNRQRGTGLMAVRMQEAQHEGQALGLPLAAVTQQVTTKDDGKGGVGDCMRACVASLLGLSVDDVPHFARYGLNDEPPDKHGWWWAFIGFCDTLEPSHEVLVPDEPPPPSDDIADLFGMYLATGKSPRGDWNHVVICRGGEVIWDPHPDRLGIDGEPIEINVVRRRARCA